MRRLLLIALFASTTISTLAQEITIVQTDNSSALTHTMTHSAEETGVNSAPVSEPGQGAFAAIAEIVAVLEADPHTDWSKVNISVLREHLRDMNLVTIDAKAVSSDIENGLMFTVTGTREVAPSIKRMVSAHAGVMQGVNQWQYQTEEIDNGATISVTVPPEDMAKLKALGFFGMLAAGMHHQTHHWMMATGSNPHG